MPTEKQNTRVVQAVGQTFIIGFDGTEISANLRALLTRLQPAGVILFGRNIVSVEQTHKLLKDCQACVSTPLFTCVDMEGGRVDRFRNLTGGVPSAAAVFATGDRKLFREHGKHIGNFCRILGFNTDFAPVLDLAFEASRSVMSSRAVSARANETANYGGDFLAGLKDAGILGCGKHFPGLGEGNLDSHHELPVINKPLRELWAQDILPYRTLRRRIPFVLVSHAGYPGITGDKTPASLSRKIIAELLRKRIGYRGLVVSDDLEMGAILKTVSIEQAVIQHLRAGGDLCLVCRSEDLILSAYDAVMKEIKRDRRFEMQVNIAAKRVHQLKKRLLTSIAWKFPPAPSSAKLDRMRRQLWDFTERVQLKTISRGQEQA